MRVRIGKGVAHGTVDAPPSKSFGHRLLIGAALADGESRLHRLGQNEDLAATAECLRALGAEIFQDGEDVTVRGTVSCAENRVFPCRESGSTLRFLVPVSLLYGGGNFTGTPRLLKRGVGIYERLLPKHGAGLAQTESSVSVSGTLISGTYELPGNVSSQFVSGLLFALPLLGEDSRITVLPPFESRPYAQITGEVLSEFGVKILETGNGYIVFGKQKYRPVEAEAEGCWSNAAFFYALNALGGDVQVNGLKENSLQGDRICVDFFEKLSRPGAVLDISDCPDLAPVLFAVAAALYGGVFTGTRRLALKESDRAAVMAEELAAFGVRCERTENSVAVFPGTRHAPVRPLDGHNDHRVVMALSVLATRTGAEIFGAEAVRKSYPGFFEALRRLSVDVEIL